MQELFSIPKESWQEVAAVTQYLDEQVGEDLPYPDRRGAGEPPPAATTSCSRCRLTVVKWPRARLAGLRIILLCGLVVDASSDRGKAWAGRAVAV